MGLVEISVFFFVYILTFILIVLFSLFLGWINGDQDISPWLALFLLNVGFSYVLTYILSMKGII